MGKHATQGNSQVGHKNQTMKHGAKHAANVRVAMAADLAGPVKLETFTPMIFPELPRKTAFEGINPVYGDDFRWTSPKTLKLRVKDSEGRDCYIGMVRHTIKPANGKAFQVWEAKFGGEAFLLMSNKNQALGLSEAKSKLMMTLIINAPVKVPTSIIPAAPKVKTPKPYYGGGIEMEVCQVTLEPKRVCDCQHCGH